MKNSIIAILIAVFVIGCSEDFLERSSLTGIAEDNFWQSEEDAFLALNAAYSTFQAKSLYGGTLNGYQSFTAYDCFGDNAFNAWKWEGPGKYMEGTMDASNSFFLGIWDNLYQGLGRVNAVIENVEKISTNLVPQETKNELLGQAYFLRSLINFQLAVYFEEAPLITKTQTLEEAYVAKNSYDELTEQIITDLKFASQHLPVQHKSELFGYATKGAALGLLARVQMYNHKLDGEFGALSLTEQIMGLGYELHPDYAELFSEQGETSKEVLFAIRFLRGADSKNGETFSATYKASPKVDQQPMPNLVNDYYCTDGLSILNSPLYDSANKKENRDPRALATFFFKGDVFNHDLNKVFNGNLTTKIGQRKYIRTRADAEGNSPWVEGSQDFYVIRYADVLLMRAEALAETGNVAEAMQLVNTIRARVGMPTVESVEGGDVSSDQMLAIVKHERRVELALEGLRFFDLKRWGEMEQATQRAAADPIGSYNPQYLGKKSETFPIPQQEIDVNSLLVQHAAW